MAERNTYESLQAGMDSAKAADSQFDLMKGRTYIPRMSPETTKAIIEAIRARRKKKADEKTAKKTAERKKASDDYFAGEADKAMDRYAKEDKANQIEERLLKDRGNEMINKYRYGGKTKKYRK